MPERLLVFAELTANSPELRKQALSKFKEIADEAQKNEPGVTKYAGLVPREDDGVTIYMTEEYVDQDSLDAHINLPLVKALSNWFASENVLARMPIVSNHQYLPSFRFTRPEIQQHDDPHVLFAELDYIPGGIEPAVPYWKDVVETGRDKEPGTLHYGILNDKDKEFRLNAFEAYESAEYLRDVHVPSEAIQKSIANTKHLRTGLKHRVMKRVLGYLDK